MQTFFIKTIQQDTRAVTYTFIRALYIETEFTVHGPNDNYLSSFFKMGLENGQWQISNPDVVCAAIKKVELQLASAIVES